MRGVEKVINTLLRLDQRLSYEDRTSCELLSNKPLKDFDGSAFVRRIYEQLEQNGRRRLEEFKRAGKPPSEENWRWEPRPTLTIGKTGKGHRGAEVPLERTIAILSAMRRFGLRNEWTNQMPVASALTSDRDGRRCIDLVHRCGAGTYDFIELKTSGPHDSDNPLHAAIEILVYGLIYVFSRAYRTQLNYPVSNVDPSKPNVLGDDTRMINLRVVAPADFYKFSTKGTLNRYDLEWFERALNHGLEAFLRTPTPAPDLSALHLGMTFGFEEIKQKFIDPVPDHGFVMSFEPRPVQWKESGT